MQPRNESSGIILGILLILIANLILAFASLFVAALIPGLNRNYNFIWAPITIGLWQIVYILPIVLLLKRRERWGAMKGVIAGAVITALINGSCFLALFGARFFGVR